MYFRSSYQVIVLCKFFCSENPLEIYYKMVPFESLVNLEENAF